ncbi:ATP-dependent DNA helicase RecG, partial [Candidatus Saccharibacteria bacterium]|nr:ATP-dependent DNA helicase RecG [Candidatus Saccharibacteria bacterium]
MGILQRSITDLKGVGAQLAARLASLQIKTLQDILFHLPAKYVDRTRIYPIATARLEDSVVIEGLVQKTSVVPKPRRSLVVTLADSSGKISIRFFHFNMQQQAQFKFGTKVRCFGQMKSFKNSLQMIHPEYRIIQDDAIVPVEETLTPIYPACDGVSQRLIRSLVQQALQILDPIQDSLEILPLSIRNELQYQPWFTTLRLLHMPPPDLDVGKLQKRMAFEELLAHHLILRQKRQRVAEQNAYPLPLLLDSWYKLVQSLPFELTNAQNAVIDVIRTDLQKSQPMVRLVQGDVGSGKTLVAVA